MSNNSGVCIHTQHYQAGRGVSRTSCVADVSRVLPHILFLHLQDLHAMSIPLCLQQNPLWRSQGVPIFEPVYSGFGEAWKTTGISLNKYFSLFIIKTFTRSIAPSLPHSAHTYSTYSSWLQFTYRNIYSYRDSCPSIFLYIVNKFAPYPVIFHWLPFNIAHYFFCSAKW